MKREGYTYSERRGGHLLIYDPQGHPVTGIGGSLSDKRSSQNIVGNMRRGCTQGCEGLPRE